MVRAEGFAVLFFAASLLVCSTQASIWCKDDNNNNVRWSFMYKLPRVVKNKHEVYKGNEYVYVDSNTKAPNTEALKQYWPLSSKKIDSDSDKGALANTIARLTENPMRKDLTYVVYNNNANEETENDEEEKKNSKGGHTKGVYFSL
ncbi:uncharacterized protein LOC144139711 [Haemaphysalis longicornis]